MDSPIAHSTPTSEELQAELLAMPEPPEQPDPIEEPGFEELVAVALRHVRGRRGGDLVSVILVGSRVRRAIRRTATWTSLRCKRTRRAGDRRGADRLATSATRAPGI